jgi:lysophospholipase L1-like esterase
VGTNPNGSEQERATPATGEVPVQQGSALRELRRSRMRTGLLLGALVAVCVLLAGVGIVRAQDQSQAATRDAAAYTPPPLQTPPPPQPVVYVVGDDTTMAADKGVSTAQRWPALAGESLRATFVTKAGSGAGYTRPGASDRTFTQQARLAPAYADVVLFVGGANETGASETQLTTNATSAYAAARTAAPHAKIVAVGPVNRAIASPARLGLVTATLKKAATSAKVTWVDPLGEHWLGTTTTAPTFGWHLSAAQERTLADHIAKVLTPVLPKH